MISQTAEYALRAAVCLAADPARPWTTPEIARRGRIPEGYLAKVMSALVRARVVRSRRGVGGGFVLRGAPAALSVLQVVRAVDPTRRIHRCPLGRPSHRGTLCPLHRRLDEAAALLERHLSRTSIQELLNVLVSARPLCVPGSRSGKRGPSERSRRTPGGARTAGPSGRGRSAC